MELAPRTVLEGRYRVVDLVRKGGMGAVYRVQDLRLADAVCALKQMHAPADLGPDAQLIEYRFNEEMRVLTTLRHPGIPRVMDFFRLGDTYCIIMDFVEGQNLEQLVSPPGWSPDEVLDVTEQVLDILIYLHGQTPPVIHRDIKPANLIREGASGRIKLVDFGLARMAEPQMTSNTLAGTLGYAPVEQMQGRAQPASDLYAVGATMHHLLTGEPPRAFSPLPILTVRTDVDSALAALVDQSVGMMPEERYASAEAMRDAVRQVRAGVPPPAAPVSNGGGRERILVVDDDAVVRDVVRRILERELYQVEVATSGQDALEKALHHAPDLVVSDLNMPGMDGVALCQKLRNYRQTRDVPVLLLTGRDTVEDEARGLESGAEDYVVKPIVPARLIARVQAVLRRHTR